jgi:hypothetical protein
MRPPAPKIAFIQPCLPSTADKPPSGANWIHEIKHDGCRLMARREPVGVRLLTQRGNDWSRKFKNPGAPAVRRRRIGASKEPPFRHDVVRTGWMPMSKRGPRRDRKQFPYEAQVVGGKLLMPADLQRLHRFMLETEVIEAISEEMRAVVERLWRELVFKLPAAQAGHKDGYA